MFRSSGGQKARISLARAFYSSAPIVLLDDVLSALDVHTTQFIVDNLFRGPLAENRTIIIVTHHVSLVKPVASYLVNLSINGTVASQGPIEKMDIMASEEVEADKPIIDSEESAEGLAGDDTDKEAAEKKKNDGKLVIAEEKASGRVSRDALFSYFRSAGGPIFWTIYFLDIVGGGESVEAVWLDRFPSRDPRSSPFSSHIAEILFAFCNYWLGLWSAAYDKTSDPSDVSIAYYMSIYILLMLLQIGSYSSSTILWMFGSLRASKLLHSRLVDSVLGAQLRFLDQTPLGKHGRLALLFSSLSFFQECYLRCLFSLYRSIDWTIHQRYEGMSCDHDSMLRYTG